MSDFQIFSGATSSPPLIALSQTTPVVFCSSSLLSPILWNFEIGRFLPWSSLLPSSHWSCFGHDLTVFAILNEFTMSFGEKLPNNPAMYVAISNQSEFQLFPRENVDIWNQSDFQLFSGGNVAQLSQRECRLPHS